jgi:hypothetical protein
MRAVERPGWVDGWAQEWDVVVEPVRMPKIVFFGYARAYRHPNPYPYAAALFGRMHVRLAGQIREWTPYPDRVPEGEWSRGA